MKSRKLLMIPGPIEFEPSVLRAMGAPTTSHVAPSFIQTFSNVIKMMREVWFCPSGQPFVVAGSGTLAMDMAGANLIEPGDKALVVSTGYFGERYANLLDRYGADVTVLRTQTGHSVSQEELEESLNKKSYKLLTFTHVDTSTAVRVDAKMIGELGQKFGVLTVLDGVCSVAGEEIRQAEWGIDVVLTASQKAIGVPPGLALLVASEKAMDVWRSRSQPVANYYADWANWLPIMEAYENLKPAYFGTPAVNLIAALEISLEHILKEGIENRFLRHHRAAMAIREGLKSMGMSQLPVDDSIASNTLSAPRYPDNSGPELLQHVNHEGVILAGGLLPGLNQEYFRIGHMGSVTRGDVIMTLHAIGNGLLKMGSRLEIGLALEVASKAYDQ